MGKNAVKMAREINTVNLRQLATGEVDVIHVKGFYPPELCAKFAEHAINNQNLEFYNKKYVDDVARLYTPYADAHGDPAAEDAYHAGAMASIEATREVFYPNLSPMDHARLMLEEQWPGGATLQELNGKKCFGGIMRVFAPGGAEFHAHYDRLDEETDAPEVKGIQEQFGMNIYLQVPDEGGDLQMWLRDATDDEREHVREKEGLPHGSIEPPVHTIHPQAGDLIMMSSWLLHAVTPCVDKARVSIGSFIGCYGEEKPLTVWS